MILFLMIQYLDSMEMELRILPLLFLGMNLLFGILIGRYPGEVAIFEGHGRVSNVIKINGKYNILENVVVRLLNHHSFLIFSQKWTWI